MRKGFGKAAALMLAAGVVATVPVAVSFAQSATETVNTRRALMKELGSHSKAIADFLKGSEDPKTARELGTIGDMELRGEAVAAIAVRIVAMFPAGTGVDTLPNATGAKPEIWSDAAGFAAAANTLKTLAEATQKAAESGDKAALAKAFAAMGKSCGGCHTKYRQKI